ncbi:MAG TPA: protein translocase subunit SecD [Anaerolineales bacterium]|nr:protein translocase subunit SecD [Anaerolineales bacterium]
MSRSRNFWLAVIVVLIALSLWVDLSKTISITSPTNGAALFNLNTDIRLGLDLRGGLQTLLQADVPSCAAVDPNELNVTRQILESRANALGVSEVTMQVAGNCRIVAEFPGISNPEQVVAALQQTGLLEFVDMGSSPVPVGTVIKTDYGQTATQPALTGTAQSPTAIPNSTATPEPLATATAIANTAPAATAQPSATQTAPATVYHTVMTGAALDTVNVQTSSVGQYEIAFTLKSNGTQVFGDYTTANVGKYLAIVLDKKVISVPVINSAITGGQGVIQGNFTADSANALAVQLRYGSLPVPVKVVESETVGPTLGAESVRKSLLAGMIGLSVVIIFMGLYYRLPGILADLALVTYSLISLMLFKIIPVTLTLPGIAGFILSIGMAVDANILIFERLKEELRSGRTLRQAIDLGWSRAWPSIRDSNSSTLITCLILYIFGNTFGASIVKGFSINLALGVLISLFTAIIVTRTYLHVVLDNLKLDEHPNWFGL